MVTAKVSVQHDQTKSNLQTKNNKQTVWHTREGLQDTKGKAELTQKKKTQKTALELNTDVQILVYMQTSISRAMSKIVAVAPRYNGDLTAERTGQHN